jgi:pantetheine-phosphate adenylyltransferase
MRRAVYAGSFDPITLGHLWMIEQGRLAFDELVVAIGINPDKKCRFSLDDRLTMLREATASLPNVRDRNGVVASYQTSYDPVSVARPRFGRPQRCPSAR